MSGPLESITVLELGDGVSGAFAGKLLADYGAGVVKVEPPAGDSARRAGPFPDGRPHREKSALFLYLNTGKRGVTLDPASATGRRLLEALVDKVDVLVDNTPTGWLEARGLSWDRLHTVNPRLLMLSISPFGRSGPYARWRSTNLTAYAAGGHMSLTGEPDREPLVTAGHQADYQAGLNAFAAALSALLGLAVMEIGQRIEISAMECQAATLEIYLPDYAYRHSDAITKRRGNTHSAMLGIVPCEDGHLGFHVMPRQFPATARLMDADWMAGDERYSTARMRLLHNDDLTAFVLGWAATQRKRDVAARAGEVRAPVHFIHSPAEVMESPQLTARRFFRDLDDPDAGRLTYPGPPFRLGDGNEELRPAPRLGEHNVEVYGELLDLSKAELARLRAYGVV